MEGIKVIENFTNLQFDQYSRLFIAKKIINKLRKKGQKFKILDIGGHLGGTSKIFPSDSVTVADLYDIDEINYVKASALDLPFEKGSFDVVVSFDVLEHIEGKNRLKFIEEAQRVSNDIVIIAAPFYTDWVESFELQANALYKSIFHKNHPWLIEHIDNGLPKLDMILSYFDNLGIKYKVFDSNNIFLWKIMMNFMFFSGDSRLSKQSTEINKFYNLHSNDLGDFSSPSYRKIIVNRKNNKNLNNLTVSESNINLEVYGEFLEKIFVGFADILKDKKLSIEDAESLKYNDMVKKYESLLLEKNTELELIKSSRIWRARNKLLSTTKKSKAQ